MMPPSYTIPMGHYIVEFRGNDSDRSAAMNWLSMMSRRGWTVDSHDDRADYHFENMLDAMDFESQFSTKCRNRRSVSTPFG